MVVHQVWFLAFDDGSCLIRLSDTLPLYSRNPPPRPTLPQTQLRFSGLAKISSQSTILCFHITANVYEGIIRSLVRSVILPLLSLGFLANGGY